ncbi:MAG: protein kinase [Pirellulaceae bacterium]|nr:protein kinase [Pirellulaceae bacterium]
MPWPFASDFSTIVQQPQIAFRDPVLKQCRIERNSLNQPRVWSGQFAVVYKALDTNGKAKAVRAFTTEARHRRDHYARITQYLKDHSARCLVEFEYREDAIRSPKDGKWYPLVVMDWVEGLTLTDWVASKCRKGKGASIAKAVSHWLKLVEDLNHRQIAHGDLQHGNVLVTFQGRLKLVDYDGMCVPSLAGRPNTEIGIRPYQHPLRNEHTQMSPDLDRFSAWVIYVALRALAADPTLWHRHVEQTGYDRLLFRSEDFQDQSASNLYRDLLASPDHGVRSLAADLFAFSGGPLESVPALTSKSIPEPSPRITGHVVAGSTNPKSRLDRAARERADSNAAQMILEIVEGPGRGERFVIDHHDTFVAGRAADCHLRIPDDPRVSRHHFLLEALPPLACLRDLGSRNGTWVNQVLHLAQPEAADAGVGSPNALVELKHDDVIRVGQTQIRVSVKSPSVATAKGVRAANSAEDGNPGPPATERLFDRLEVGDEIGTSYLAAVHRAVDTRSGQVVALKTVLRQPDATDAVLRRVLVDLAPTQQFRHPNIAAVLEAGISNGSLYFANEFCDSGNLEQVLDQRGGRLMLAHVRTFMPQCLDALDWAHQQGIVHGHLTPRNLLFHQEGGAKICRISDFSVARVLDRAGCAGMSATAHFRSHFRFTPPERLTRFRESLPESDLWSLAAIFYLALTGRYANDVSNRDPLAAALHPEIAPIRDVERLVPPSVARVIDRALAIEVEKRYRSAAEMRTHLKRAFGLVRGG